MSVYTDVSQPVLKQLLSRYDIGTLQTLRGINQGITNSIYYFKTTLGEYILTIYEQLTVRELPFYTELVDYLVAHDIPCAKTITDKQGIALHQIDDKPAIISVCLPGTTLQTVSTEHCQQLGNTLARFHQVSSGFTQKNNNIRDTAWHEEAAKQVRPHLNQHSQTLLEQEMALLRQQPLHDCPSGIIHYDLFRDNVLFEEDRLSGLLDFNYACWHAFILDLAVCINDWCVQADGELDVIKVKNFIQAYQQVRPLQAIEKASLSVALRLAALRFWLSRLSDILYPSQGYIVQQHNPQTFQIILEKRQAMNADVFNALT